MAKRYAAMVGVTRYYATALCGDKWCVTVNFPTLVRAEVRDKNESDSKVGHNCPGKATNQAGSVEVIKGCADVVFGNKNGGVHD